MKTTRRQALQFGLSGAAAFGLTAIKPGLAIGRMPSSAAPDRKMLVIFGRGANDALNSIIPHGDPGYALSRNRPGIGDIAFRRAGTGGPRNSIVIPGAGSFAEAHPAMGDLINGAPWANGHLALLHRVGNPWGKRSHFTEMQVIESADAPQATGRPRRDGWVNRLGNVIYSTSAMQSVSLSSRVQTFFVTDSSASAPRIDTHIQRIYRKNFFSINNNGTNHDLEQLDPTGAYTLNESPADTVATQIRRGLGASADAPHGSDEDRLVRQTWRRFLDSEGSVGGLPNRFHDATRFPSNDTERQAAGLPANLKTGQYAFMQRMEEATILLNDTDAQVVGVEIGGWDTHQQQLPDHELLLRTLCRAMRSAYEVVSADTMILFVTEFGRTNRVNGSAGTDHGIGGLYMALGRNVNGGLYNCRPASSSGLGNPWQNLPTNLNDPYNAIEPATDFRAVFNEILERHFCITDVATREEIIEPWTPNTASEAAYLNFLT